MLLSFIRAFAIVCITIPFSLLATFGSVTQKDLRIFYWVTRNWSALALRISGVSLAVRGAELIPRNATFVYAANHASMFDILAALAGIPGRVNLILKKELTRVPIWGWGLRISPYIIIDRANARKAMASLDEAERRIRAGSSVLLFPEGTRTRDGKLQPFKRGGFALAARAGAPVVPVTINGSFHILPKGSLRIKPGHIELIISPPVSPQNYSEPELRACVEEEIKKNYEC